MFARQQDRDLSGIHGIPVEGHDIVAGVEIIGTKQLDLSRSGGTNSTSGFGRMARNCGRGGRLRINAVSLPGGPASDLHVEKSLLADMNRLVDAFPALAREVAESLRALGRAALAEQIDEAVLSRIRFDDSANAGYIYIEPSRALNVVETNIIGVRHGHTITVETQFDAHIDTDNFDRVVGIEILAPGVLRSELKRRARKSV